MPKGCLLLFAMQAIVAAMHEAVQTTNLISGLDCFHRALIVAGLFLLAMTLTVIVGVTARHEAAQMKKNLQCIME